jgi:invasion protein IalB
MGRFCRRRGGERTKLLLECRVEYGKRGADPQRVHRALRHEVARRLADANCGRRLAVFWRRAKRKTIPFNSSKGRLMRFQLMRASAAALAVSVALAGGALAQQTPAKPAAPGAPAVPGQAVPGAPAPPSKVDLVSPEPQWAKFCAKEPASGRDACATMRDFSTSADQPPMISINLFDVAGEERRKLRFLILPIGMLLKPGFRVIVDKNDPIEGKYDMCFQNACSAEIDIGAKTVEMLKKGQNMAVVMRVPGGDSSGRELTFNIPLKDLGPAFDGKPTDPKVLEQQRQALQQQLQKKAEDQRKALEQQQGGAPAAPVPAAPAAPAPAAPAK